jgi:hypothetical protein
MQVTPWRQARNLKRLGTFSIADLQENEKCECVGISNLLLNCSKKTFDCEVKKKESLDDFLYLQAKVDYGNEPSHPSRRDSRQNGHPLSPKLQQRPSPTRHRTYTLGQSCQTGS